jgi:hypothetical protein
VKIKSDFVTNSSSVTFIIAIPDSFTITLMQVNKLFDSKSVDFYKGTDTPEGREDLLKEALSYIDELKNGKIVYQEDFNHREAFTIITECLREKDLEIKSIDTNGDSDYKIIPVSEAMIVKIIQKMSSYNSEDIMTNIINKQGMNKK